MWGEVDPDRGTVLNHRPLKFPVECVGASCMGQIVEYENGDMLLSFNFTTRENPKGMDAVVGAGNWASAKNTAATIPCGSPRYSGKTN